MNHNTREEWLIDAANRMRPWFAEIGAEVPPGCRYTCGFPSSGGLAKKSRKIGQCWDASCSKDNTFEILVSPTLENPSDVLSTLLHEMVHAAAGLDCGHKGAFKRIATKLGFEGPMTQTPPGEALASRLYGLSTQLGKYPHATLDGVKNTGPKKQGTRMIKLECEKCGYTLRTTQKWIDVGVPVCCCGTPFNVDNPIED